MRKVIKNGNTIIVVLDNGSVLTKTVENSEDLFSKAKNATNDDLMYEMVDEYKEVVKKKIEVEKYFDNVSKSSILKVVGDSVYWIGVPELSMPKTFVEAVLKAEEERNENKLEAYRNFWVLLSLNPDSRCRENLFKFLMQWGMKISKSGLFVGYRNVDVYEHGTKDIYSKELCEYVKQFYNEVELMKESASLYWICNYDEGNEPYLIYAGSDEFVDAVTDEVPMLNLKSTYNELKAVDFKVKNIGDDTIYTDHYSHTFRIKIGEAVRMPREKCDCDSSRECSNGLHCSYAGWLKDNYFGSQGIVCLVNPCHVVAVPMDNAQYGKLRCCEYLPIALADYDEFGNVIEYNVDDGFESRWIGEILYDGEQSTEDTPLYKVEIPNIPELNKTTVDENLLKIARKYIK